MEDNMDKWKLLGREIAENLVRLGGVQTATMLPGTTVLPACGTGIPTNPCEGLSYSKIAVHRFYRGGRTEISLVEEGKIPVAPGSSVVLAQRPHPPWAAGCYSLRYRLANGGNNHDDIEIAWMIDDEQLDAVQYGTEIFNLDNTVIGDGKLPIPLAMGEHCCIGGNNRLRVRITHRGNANQIENIRLYVEHAGAVACCSACASGRSCQRGCSGDHR
ncbi:MAG: hypothetical protein R3F65_32230 [bacterium]